MKSNHLGINAYPDNMLELFQDRQFMFFYVDRRGYRRFEDCFTNFGLQSDIKFMYDTYYKESIGNKNDFNMDLREYYAHEMAECIPFERYVGPLSLFAAKRAYGELPQDVCPDDMYYNERLDLHNPLALASTVILSTTIERVDNLLIDLVKEGFDIYGAQAVIRNEMLQIRNRGVVERMPNGMTRIILSEDNKKYYDTLIESDKKCIKYQKEYSPYYEVFNAQYAICLAKQKPEYFNGKLGSHTLIACVEAAEEVMKKKLQEYDPEMLLRVTESRETALKLGEKVNENYDKKQIFFAHSHDPEITACYALERRILDAEYYLSDKIRECDLNIHVNKNNSHDNSHTKHTDNPTDDHNQ